jgi:hypothetical protein
MKKFLTTLAALALVLGAVTVFALPPGIGPGGGGPIGPGPGGGTVTSVGLAMPAEFTVSGSPVLGSGTITVTEATQTANYCYCGPTTGAAAAPGYRALVSADIPSLSATYLPLAGGTMAGELVCANDTEAITSGNYTLNIEGAITATGGADTAVRIGATADLSAADKVLVVQDNNTTDLFSIAGDGAATFVGPVGAPAGTSLLPGMTFSGDPNTGISAQTGDIMVLSAGGTTALTLTTTGVTPDLPVYAPSGTCAAPKYAFSEAGREDNGLSLTTGSDNMDVCVAGAAQMTFDATNTTSYNNLLFSADNTLDIGASGATRPRTVYVGTDVNVGGDVNITDDLTCNQATMTVDALTALTAPSVTTAVASDGILLRNTTAAATAQEFSPSLRLDGVGYTAGPTNTRQSWAITNKPTSATAGTLSFDFASAGGTYANKATLDAAGVFTATQATLAGMTITNQSINSNGGAWYLSTGNTYFGGFARQSYYSGVNNGGISFFTTGDAGANWAHGAIALGTYKTTAAEGYNLATFWNSSTVRKSSIDKDGVYWQGYASGQVTDAVPSLALTLVTAMDDDTIYDVTVGCQYIGYAAGAVDTPTYHFSSVIGASLIRIDGVASEVGANTVISHKEDASAACVPCAVSFTNGATDSITATFTQCHLDADVANVKAWIKSMTKTNITTFTGVNYPAAN